MSDQEVLETLQRALATVVDPELHKPMLQLGMLRDISVAQEVVSLRVVLTTPAKATLPVALARPGAISAARIATTTHVAAGGP